MITGVTHVTVLVDDVDDAIDWYTDRLGFELRNDEEMAPGERWVTVAPEASGDDAGAGDAGGTEIVLQEPSPEFHGEEQAARMRERIGDGTMTVFATDDCRGDVDRFREAGVTITSGPEEAPWGVSATFEDLYGNPYNLVEEF